MSKLVKALGLVSALAALSDVSGMAAFYSDRGPADEAPPTVTATISEDYRPSAKKPRRPQAGKAVEVKSSPNDTPRQPVSSNSTLFADIVAERELFTRFDFGGYKGNTLCGINREMGKGRIGLLLLEPSGILKSIVIDRNSLKALHTKVSIPRKELREELSRHGITVSDVLLIARQVAGILESKDAAGTPESRKGTKALTKIREEISEKPELSAMQKDEILERFRKDLAVIDEQAVTKQ